MLTFMGTTNRDELFSTDINVNLREQGVELELGGNTIALPTLERPVNGGKVTAAQIPDAVYGLSRHGTFGGGVFNSAMAARQVTRSASFRYLDVSGGGADVKARLARNGFRYRSLGLQPLARNLVLGSRSDKLIVRAPLHTARVFGSARRDDAATLAWLLRGTSVLANSVKSPELMAGVTAVAAAGLIRMYLVLTPSLAKKNIPSMLSVATAVFAGADELTAATGMEVARDLDGALSAVAELRELAPSAWLFVTLGKNGVVIAEPGAQIVQHVRLRGAAAEAASVIARRSPARLSGCGDAFAGGSYLFLETQRTLLAGPLGLTSTAALAGASGCCTALRWLGLRRSLSVADFERHDYVLSVIATRAA